MRRARRLVFHRGDANGDGALDLADAVAILDFLFRGGAEPGCLETADADNDARIGITDAVVLLAYLFQAGPPPADPGPPDAPCGPDPEPAGEPGHIGCAGYGACR